MKRDIDLRGASRRDFIKGVLATSAALGLGPTRALEALDGLGGSALAQEAAKLKYSVNFVGGTGGGSWFTQIFPVPNVIKNFAAGMAYDDITKAEKISGVDGGRDLYMRKLRTGKRLWSEYGDRKLISALPCGRPQAHEVAPSVASSTNLLPGGVGGPVNLYAGFAAIQTSLKALVPSIGMKFNNVDMPYGRAPGAPPQSSVADAASMIALFSSAASQVMSRLQTTQNQAAYELYYKAFLGLAKNSSRATFQRAFGDSRVALSLLAKNLRSALEPKPGQADMWMGGIAANEKVRAITESMIVTANAFKLGLCAQVTIPCFNDDPHGAFGSISNVGNVTDATASALQFFLDDLAKVPDASVPGRTLADKVIMTFTADTFKDPFTAAGWPDGYTANVNWIYVMSQGLVKPGWFGDVRRDGKTNYDPATGMLSAGVPDDMQRSGALAAVLYAAAGGDSRRVRDFYNAGDFGGLVNVSLTG